jgi:hypothetical protein
MLLCVFVLEVRDQILKPKDEVLEPKENFFSIDRINVPRETRQAAR